MAARPSRWRGSCRMNAGRGCGASTGLTAASDMLNLARAKDAAAIAERGPPARDRRIFRWQFGPIEIDNGARSEALNGPPGTYSPRPRRRATTARKRPPTRRKRRSDPARAALAPVQHMASDPIAPAPLINVFLRDKKLILYETAVVFG
jgi:hypothetical protein